MRIDAPPRTHSRAPRTRSASLATTSLATASLATASLVATTLAPATLAAQARLAPAGFTIQASAVRPPARDTAPARIVDHSQRGRVVTRGLIGTLGAVGGTVAGIVIANAMPHGPCNCDDPGLSQALAGGAIGMAAGGTLAAGSLPLGDGCTFGSRLASATVGGLLGTVGGVAATVATRGVAVPLMPIGAGFGAGYTSTLCRR